MDPSGFVFVVPFLPLLLGGLLFIAFCRIEMTGLAIGRFTSRSNRLMEAGLDWRMFGSAVANITIPLLASRWGLAAFAGRFGPSSVASAILHALNLGQGLVGLWLMGVILSRWEKPVVNE